MIRGFMSKINEATDTDLKVIERLGQLSKPKALWRIRVICHFIITMGYNYSIK